MKQGNNCQIGQFTAIADDVRLGNNVVIGNRVTLFPAVTVEDNTRILDGAVIGRMTYRTRSVSRPAPTSHQPLTIGPDSVIGCNVVLYTGVKLGREVLLADGVSIREGCVIGDEVFMGRYVMVNYNAVIEKRTRIIDMAYINGNTFVGEDCFISMHVSTANDNDVYLRRFGMQDTDRDVQGPHIGHYVTIGQGALINPGVRIGDASLIGTGAVVTRDIPAWSVAMGVPARRVRAIDPETRRKISDLASGRGQTLENEG